MVMGFLVAQTVKKILLQCGRPGFNPGLGRSPGGGHGNPLQYSGLENPHGQRSGEGIVHGVAKSQKQLSTAHMESRFKDGVWAKEAEIIFILLS